MANVNATVKTAQVATPPNRLKTQQLHGRIRYFESTYTAPPTGMPAIADTITWGDIPQGARIIGHLSQMRWGAGTASSTLNLGDGTAAARHLAATSITAAGSAIPEAAAVNGAPGVEVTDAGVVPATNNSTLISTIAGAGLAANQVITLRVAYVMD